MASNVLKICVSKGFLLDKEMLQLFSGLTDEGAQEVIAIIGSLGIKERVITKGLFEKYFSKFKQGLLKEKGIVDVNALFQGLGYLKEGEPSIIKEEQRNVTGKVKLLSAPAFLQKKIEVKDFVQHFRSRFEKIKGILEAKEFENLTTFRRLGPSSASYTIIACVIDKKVTKNKNILIEAEDLTGKGIILINQNKKEVFEKAKALLQDDIVAFEVNGSKEMLFANEIVYPDTILSEKRTSEFDEYVAFISDVHVGSTMFLEKNFLTFIKWLNGEEGDEKQRAMAKKVKYLFIVGDVIDGISVYPGQEAFLIEKTPQAQYKKLSEMLSLIRSDVQKIMCPGQHDSVWIGEPQPIVSAEWGPDLYNVKNLHLVPNPSLVEIDGGFKILMYHGASINSMIDEIPEIRTKYKHTRPTLVVKELLKRRHLAPIHGMVDYIPCEQDPLVIEAVPDIVATGDQHRSELSYYNNILLIAGSCWQSITPFEEKVGNVPDPCKVPLFNLKTREVKVLDFTGEGKGASSLENKPV